MFFGGWRYLENLKETHQTITHDQNQTKDPGAERWKCCHHVSPIMVSVFKNEHDVSFTCNGNEINERYTISHNIFIVKSVKIIHNRYINSDFLMNLIYFHLLYHDWDQFTCHMSQVFWKIIQKKKKHFISYRITAHTYTSYLVCRSMKGSLFLSVARVCVSPEYMYKCVCAVLYCGPHSSSFRMCWK